MNTPINKRNYLVSTRISARYPDPIPGGRRLFMDQTDQSSTPELPNGPAKLTTDLKKDRFKLEYAGDNIFQATVRLVRDGAEIALKDAGVRLFVVSKSDGWNIVTQTVRIAVVASLPGDTIVVRGNTTDVVSEVELLTLAEGPVGVHGGRQDWLISVDPGPVATLSCVDVPAKNGEPDATRPRAIVEASGVDVTLRFRPHYKARHYGR